MTRGKPIAIVAIAGKLLVAVWYVLTNQVADVHADEDAIARKLMHWITQAGAAKGRRGARVRLLRQVLDQLAIGASVESVRHGGQTYAVPTSTTPATPGLAGKT